jgi:hypothetical protein
MFSTLTVLFWNIATLICQALQSTVELVLCDEKVMNGIISTLELFRDFESSGPLDIMILVSLCRTFSYSDCTGN